jgi:uncharacterized damage-inducible protein DinB
VTPQQMLSLFQFNQWANQRVLGACSALSDEQFTRALGSSFPSVRDTLAHLYGAEWIWYERLFGRSSSSLPIPSDFPDVTALRKKLEGQDEQFIQYISKITPADLDRVFQYKNLAGTELSNPLWQMLQHVANHSTYHRGQVITLLRQLGAKPVSTDLIAFYREQAAGAHA